MVTLKYRPEIDGLRALAVIPVILYHAGFLAFSGGFIGVDIFFVISGYLISTIIISEIESGAFSIVEFYEKRARRILPALFFVIICCLPFAWLWLLPEDMKSFSQSLLAVPTFVSNILFWKTSGYFDVIAELKPLLHTWSLAVEEQYYLLFPLLLKAVWRYGKAATLGLLILLFLSSLGLAHWASAAKPDAAYYLLLTRGWELLLGTFVSCYCSWAVQKKPSILISQSAGILGIAAIVYSIFQFNSQTPFPSFYTLLPTLGAGLIIIYGRQVTLAGTILSNKIIVRTGLLSYSAYLWHQPLLAFARHRSFEGITFETTLLVLVLTGVLAYLTWKYVESPFRNRSRFSKREIFIWSGTAATLLMALGLAGTMTNGFENRFTFVSAHEGDVGQKDFYKLIDSRYFLCNARSIAEDPENKVTFRCLQSQSKGNVDIALIGDSHAEHLFIGMAEALPDKNILLHARGAFPSMDKPEFKKIYQYVLETPSIHTVIISAHWISRVDNVPKDSTFDGELAKTINAMMEKGKTVYLLGDVPKFPFPPERCKFIADGLGGSICHADRNRILLNELGYSKSMDKVISSIPGLHYIDMAETLCTQDRCSMLKDNQLMYRDNHHLNIPGSRYVGGELVKKLLVPLN